MKDLKKMVEDALMVQDACNLRGISKSYAKMIEDLVIVLKELNLPYDTMSIRRHPINILWASKICDLAELEIKENNQIEDAYNFCRNVIKTES